jgi:hypothetical protein
MEHQRMAEKILNFFHELFFQNFFRKLLALFLAIVIWFLVDNTLTTTKTFHNIPIKIVNLPKGKTIEGIQENGIMSKRMSLILSGRRAFLERLTSSDFEVVIDAGNQPQDEWVITISKRNLVSFSTELNLQTEINKVSHKNFIVKLVKLSHEKIPIFITQPIGEAPKGYQYLDIWPYQLTLSVSGPESTISKLKARGVKLSFNLNDISKSELENLPSNHQLQSQDIVSFFVPKDWKQVLLPTLSDTPITIDDPDAKFLRIDFIRSELIPIGNAIPVGLFYPPRLLESPSLLNYKFAPSPLLMMKNHSPLLTFPLYAKGVSDLFVQIVKDNIEIVLTFPQKIDSKYLEWSVLFINPKMLEDHYVSLVMSDINDDETKELQPEIRQKYLRNRFRNYMNRFQLFYGNQKPLDLSIEIKNNQLHMQLKNEPTP